MKTKLLIALISMIFILNVGVTFAGRFSDINTEDWFYETVSKLTELGGIDGYPDGTFRPNGTITRAEFTKVLIETLGEKTNQGDSYHWGEPYIATARRLELIAYDEFLNDTLDFNITRMEITRIMTRALGKQELIPGLVSVPTDFKDDESISASNKGFVIVANKFGILNGYPDGTFRPNATATRAEATQMIVTFLENRYNDIVIEQPQPTEDDLVIDEMIVQTSHPEIIPHIKKTIEILEEYDGYLKVSYHPDGNGQVSIKIYKTKEDSLIPIWEEPRSIINCLFDLEHDPRAEKFIPYCIKIGDINNEILREKYLLIIENLIPEGKEIIKEKLFEVIDTKKNLTENWFELGERTLILGATPEKGSFTASFGI
jgi:hypothetical protein